MMIMSHCLFSQTFWPLWPMVLAAAPYYTVIKIYIVFVFIIVIICPKVLFTSTIMINMIIAIIIIIIIPRIGRESCPIQMNVAVSRCLLTNNPSFVPTFLFTHQIALDCPEIATRPRGHRKIAFMPCNDLFAVTTATIHNHQQKPTSNRKTAFWGDIGRIAINWDHSLRLDVNTNFKLPK